MTLQSSGVITLNNIQTEFGGSNPIAISEYYAKDTGIPTSGLIKFSHFYGKSYVPPPPVFSPIMFTPTRNYSFGGTAVNDSGMPLGYDPSVYGAVIWPRSYGSGDSGWVGQCFRPNRSGTVVLQFAADNICYVYVGGTLYISSSNWTVWNYAYLSVAAGTTYSISAHLIDSGGFYGFAGRVYFQDTGEVLLKTDTGWLSA